MLFYDSTTTFASSEKIKELEPRWVQQLFSGIVTGDAPVSYWLIFPFPEDFAKVNLTHFPFLF